VSGSSTPGDRHTRFRLRGVPPNLLFGVRYGVQRGQRGTTGVEQIRQSREVSLPFELFELCVFMVEDDFEFEMNEL
jgi:hypothetical protein